MELILHNLWKCFGPVESSLPALRGVSLHLRPGITALLGPNGSGKTTLLRCLATLINPEQGKIRWGNLESSAGLRAIRAGLGYLPQDLEFPAAMTPRKLLEHLAYLKGASDPNQPAALLACLGLAPLADQPFSCLSGGQVRLAAVAQAFLGRPRLVLLDEPTRGLDVQERERLFALMRLPAAGRLVVFSTQQPGEVPAVTHQVVILKEGRLRYSGSAPLGEPLESFYLNRCQPS